MDYAGYSQRQNMNDTKTFYRSFEDKYRGSRSLIKSRLMTYLSFLEKLKKYDTHPTAMDIGCGRGEWLELLQENHIEAKGVDIDEGMLEACMEMGFSVQHKDALLALQEQKDETLSLVSGFHIAEHLPFDILQKIVCEALRVLKPGGLLILETPNPENITVATESFYLDPTHVRPLPSQLLSFIAQHYGFERNTILRLQESHEICQKKDATDITLFDVLSETSPDYAVVAQKKAQQEICMHFDELFTKSYGISLEVLARRYEERIKHQEKHTNLAFEQIINAQNRADEAYAQAKAAWQSYEMMLNSNSWKITQPLRYMGKQIRTLLKILKGRP